jgi:hypothetical protein
MAVSQAAYKLEKAIGHDSNAITQQDVSSYETTGEENETMMALVWMGKNKVEMGSCSLRFALHQGSDSFCSTGPQTENPREWRRYSQGHWIDSVR